METPMDPNAKQYEHQRKLLSNPKRYHRLVDKLNHLTISRLNISFAISKDPRLPHWEAVIRILRYLKAHPGRDLLNKANGHLRLEYFTDTD